MLWKPYIQACCPGTSQTKLLQKCAEAYRPQNQGLLRRVIECQFFSALLWHFIYAPAIVLTWTCPLYHSEPKTILQACAASRLFLHCRFTKQGILIHDQIHCDITGKVVRASENLDQAISELEQKYRKRPVAIGWHECRQLLFDQLPPSIVEFDKQVSSIIYRRSS